MTKTELRKLQGGKSLLEIALDLHGLNTGSTEAPAGRREECVKVLSAAVGCWEPAAFATTRAFDAAVFNLLCAVLQETYWMEDNGA